tara:strand:- start:235 stop:741 length:507 start_codon:yes stop_codon:yes gene_type:complete
MRFYNVPLPSSCIPGLLFYRSDGVSLFILYHPIFQVYVLSGNDGTAWADANVSILHVFDYLVPLIIAFLTHFLSRAFVVQSPGFETFLAAKRLAPRYPITTEPTGYGWAIGQLSDAFVANPFRDVKVVFTDRGYPALGATVGPTTFKQTFRAYRTIFRDLVNVYIPAC